MKRSIKLTLLTVIIITIMSLGFSIGASAACSLADLLQGKAGNNFFSGNPFSNSNNFSWIFFSGGGNNCMTGNNPGNIITFPQPKPPQTQPPQTQPPQTQPPQTQPPQTQPPQTQPPKTQPPQTQPPQTQPPQTANTYAEEVLRYVNQARAENGLSALVLNSALSNAAEVRAKEIRTYFSHTRPNGTSCFTVLRDFGISYKICGENIALGYSDAKTVVNGWLGSPSHRANILNPSYKQMGLGKSDTGWCQLFIG